LLGTFWVPRCCSVYSLSPRRVLASPLGPASCRISFSLSTVLGSCLGLVIVQSLSGRPLAR
jgi:hypothetical protein